MTSAAECVLASFVSYGRTDVLPRFNKLYKISKIKCLGIQIRKNLSSCCKMVTNEE